MYNVTDNNVIKIKEIKMNETIIKDVSLFRTEYVTNIGIKISRVIKYKQK